MSFCLRLAVPARVIEDSASAVVADTTEDGGLVKETAGYYGDFIWLALLKRLAGIRRTNRLDSNGLALVGSSCASIMTEV